ncbi:MAG: CBS domain-containing protein [Candidatus Woesearchaeota archaeon]
MPKKNKQNLPDTKKIPVSKIMKKSFRFVHKGTEIKEILGLFHKYDVEAFPVVNSKGKLIGEITENQMMPFAISTERLSEHDIIGALGTRIQTIFGARVGDIMNMHELTVEKTNTLEDAAYLMWKHDVRCLPVVDKETNKFLGVVFQKNIIDFIKKYKEELIQ